MKVKEIEWKGTVIKSIIYRGITLVLGTLTAFILTGSIAIATGVAILTEAVQSVNWSNISRRKLEKKIIEKLANREINLKISYSSILDLAYQLSQIDTFIPKLYLSTLQIFDKMLENEELEEIHEDIEKYKEHFVSVHSGRKLYFPKEKAN